MKGHLQLEHHGTKGMKWGLRRFQNKDGSLTPIGKKRVKESEGDKEETAEQTKARVLSSTNAKDIYKNKHLLTTAEINERLTRIDTESRLSKVAAETKTTGMQRVDNILKVAKKANEIYEFTNTPLGKHVKKSLFGKGDNDDLSPDLEKVLANKSKMTDDQLTKVLKRSSTEKALENLMEDIKRKRGDA